MTRVRVKICGVTRGADAALAAALGADAVGFVLWPRSPRAVGLDAAAEISRALPPFVTRVGVFVNASPDEVSHAVDAIGLDVAQLHGDEPVARYRHVASRLIKAVAAETSEDVQEALTLPPEVAVLVDAADRERRGGTGRTANWDRAADLAQARPIVLSGGLTAANIAAALRQVQPWGVDVSSGVEDAPGVKNPAKLREFFEAVRNANGD